jgi:hypothetical protein
MGFKPTAKGTVSYDVTAEAPNAETAAILLKDGLAKFKEVAKEKGFTVNEGGVTE